MSDAINQAIYNLERMRQNAESILPPQTTVEVGFNPSKYAQPQPVALSLIPRQQTAILENHDLRVDELIKDLGGVDVCAKLYASQLIAMMDKANSVG